MITISLSHSLMQSAIFEAFSAALTHPRGTIYWVKYKETFIWVLRDNENTAIDYDPIKDQNSLRFLFDRGSLNSADPHDFIPVLERFWSEAKSTFDI